MPTAGVKSIPTLAAGILAAIGVGVLVGWVVPYESLMTVFPGLIRMKPNTGVGFLLAASALGLASRRRFGIVRESCASLIALLGVVTITA
jgi:hypothetical protein